MTARICAASCWLMIFAVGLLAENASLQKEKPIVIVMTANGKFVEKSKLNKEGADKEAVEVKVGQSVVWTNDGTLKHSAISDMINPETKKPLFHTGDIAGDDDSKPVAFTAEIFKLAGGKKDGFVMIPYFCEQHRKEKMIGTIKLIDAGN